MTEIEKYFVEQSHTLVPVFDKLEVKAIIDSNSYSIELFFTINGVKKQCYDLADDGLFDEDELDELIGKMAVELRKSPEYSSEKINKIQFEIVV